MTSRKLLAALALLFFSASAFASEKEITLAAHAHSSVSSGARDIAQIAKTAREQGVEAVLLTDLLVEQYSYYVANIKRPSVWDGGVPAYLKQIEEANRLFPEVLMMDAVVATPFYYWTGNPLQGLVMHNRAKDLLVMGLSAGDYENLPVIGTGKSKFNPYQGEKYSEPYQALIDNVRSKKGLVFWSHPDANEHYEYSMGGMKVKLESAPYRDDVIGTSNYTGIGVFPTELSQMFSPSVKGLTGIDGVWDRLLNDYCKGRRAEPVWALAEVDFAGRKAGERLDGILNVVQTQNKTRAGILEALQNGRFYLVIPNLGGGTNRIAMNEFSAREAGSSVTLTLDFTLTGPGPKPMRFVLLRGGEIIKEWDQEVPFRLEITDEPPPGMTYYRLLAASREGDRLLSNPIFLRRKPA